MTTATRRTLFLVFVGLAVVGIAYLARAVVTPLLAALILAYILDPVVRAMERLGLSRKAASAVLVVVAFVMIVGSAVFAARRLGARP